MRITFGLSLDGYELPEPDNSLGAVVTGPSGMLELVETLARSVRGGLGSCEERYNLSIPFWMTSRMASNGICSVK